jgi:lysozyme
MDNAAIQKELAKRGLYSGKIDGVVGPGTMKGINAALSTFNTNGWPDSHKLIGFEQLVYKEAGMPSDVDGILGSQTLANRGKYAAPSSGFVPRVVDIYHGDDVEDFHPAANAGVWGIIHKASQGTTYKDVAYDERRKLAAEVDGLLWGAYHFNTGENVSRQVDFFLKSAQPKDDTLMVLDYENNKKSDMSAKQMVEFLHLLEQKLGRKGALYSGNKLKETIGQLNDSDFEYVKSHRLWICQYGPRVKLPQGFDSWWLWQFTGDGIGPMPHYVPGITVPGGKGIDLNRVPDGVTREQFAATWS